MKIKQKVGVIDFHLARLQTTWQVLWVKIINGLGLEKDRLKFKKKRESSLERGKDKIKQYSVRQ